MNRAEGEVRPRVFFEDFPNVVLYVREVPPTARAGSACSPPTPSNPSTPVIYLAKRGRMVVDRAGADDQMVLEDGTRHSTKLDDPAALRGGEVRAARSCRSIPRACSRAPGRPAASASCRVEELQARAVELEAAGHLAAQPDHGDPQEVLDPGRVLRLRAARPRARRQQSQGRQAGGFVLGIARDLRLLRRDVHRRRR